MDWMKNAQRTSKPLIPGVLWRRADHNSVEQVGKSILSVDRARSNQPKPQTQQNMKVRSPFSVLMSCLRHQRTPSTLNARTYATEGWSLFPCSGSFLLRLNFIARLLGSSTCGQPAVRLLGAHRKTPLTVFMSISVLPGLFSRDPWLTQNRRCKTTSTLQRISYQRVPTARNWLQQDHGTQDQ